MNVDDETLNYELYGNSRRPIYDGLVIVPIQIKGIEGYTHVCQYEDEIDSMIMTQQPSGKGPGDDIEV